MCLRRSRNSSRSTKTLSHCSLRAFVENTEFHHRADGTKPADKYCDQPLLTGLSSLWRWLTRCPVGVQSVSSCIKVKVTDRWSVWSVLSVHYLVSSPDGFDFDLQARTIAWMLHILTGSSTGTFWHAGYFPQWILHCGFQTRREGFASAWNLLQARAVHFQMNRTNTATEEQGICFFF